MLLVKVNQKAFYQTVKDQSLCTRNVLNFAIELPQAPSKLVFFVWVVVAYGQWPEYTIMANPQVTSQEDMRSHQDTDSVCVQA